MDKKKQPLLTVNKLAIDFETKLGVVRAVENVSFSLEKGEILALVGESGSGKSVTAYSILNLLDKNGSLALGEIIYDGMPLHRADSQLLKEIRGREISMIFQNPMSTLNPIRKVGEHLRDMLRTHGYASWSSINKEIEKLLQQVEIYDVERVKDSYPFELSGGMCQRVMIALALACRSRMLIADEPTTGLDVTTQKSIMDLIHNLAKTEGLAVILITHDLGIAAEYCDKFVVMEKGKVVEKNTRQDFFTHSTHPYTKKLLQATPSKDGSVADLTVTPPDYLSLPEPEISEKPLLVVDGLRKTYLKKKSAFIPFSKPTYEEFVAVDGSSFSIYSGECVGLVGGSGSGKSTTSKLLTRLEDATAGSIKFSGVDISSISNKDFIKHPLRKDIQMVFQDPTGSLNPRHSVFDLIAEPLLRLGDKLSKQQLKSKVEELVEQVGLPMHLITRLPHQLSGGQKARVGIARAVALKPKFLILDEPTSALDVSVQATVLQLLEKLRRELGLSYLFVSHDLHVVKMLSQRILVMQEGKIVEQGKTQEVMYSPKHPYTKKLIESIPHIKDIIVSDDNVVEYQFA
ncbi:ABC transporter ATP-binding protein [Vibrio sp. CK2-1]|uniref:dipeptide ABC transporter ATP-binding protein n=1 Tax=Vibrio sp. CK2-1 TaxID=2912249 RepID=UPI001F31AE2B|nr:ABC transporter ATP-binding protein [Vibrio sp. CK2-1]MCF7352839.1 ABC transporter ATP-binding protein [Vibrio sp. CK2-1]